ncbi:TrkH family potassium uptake protein [Alteromonas mediterranea]|uniref:TrkH family potassium uptake protein n=1 Tax=Alteromonas mediterranea TaxID=314275 RepID=UPI0012F9273F|nr:TrkH family potassium uptake protein [Alteromonas mediterranea]QGX63073.1 Ktr system potassium transporter B [Alteromonas mediterranea]
MTRWNLQRRPLSRKAKSAYKIQAAPPLILSLSFLAVIIIGTLLLLLPGMTTQPITFADSLFTATSAVTVTGLVVVDTGTAFTTLGLTVIALLIQIGGLGLMTFAVVTLIALGGRISFLQQSAIKEAFNQTDLSTLAYTARSVLIFAFIIEMIGFTILALFWLQSKPPAEALFHAFFYTISAFNNAGFALSSDSLSFYVGNPVVNLTITGLFIIGGLGFSVWIDLIKKRTWQKLSVYSKLMISSTIIVNAIALLLIYSIEKDNPNTLANLDAASQWWASWFQAVTPRTAGFNTVDISALENATTWLTLLLMFIGGGSMSTASGIKLVTFIVLIMSAYSYLRRDPSPAIFGCALSSETRGKALALTLISTVIAWLSIFILSMTENAAFIDIIFEAISALGTVGLSRGLTGELSDAGGLVIIFLMFIGRLGPLTIAYFLASPRQKRIKYPNSTLPVG